MKYIIWDLDGTLLNSKQTNMAALATAFESAGLRAPTSQEFDAHFHGTLEETLIGLLAEQNIELDESDFSKIESDFLRLNEQSYDAPEQLLYPDAVRLVQHFRDSGAQQIIVTNRKHERRGDASPRAIVQNSSLNGCISYIVCGDDLPYRKPDVRVLEGLDVPDAKDIVVIGDQTPDVLLARNLNARAVIVRRSDARTYQPDGVDVWRDFCDVVSTLDDVVSKNLEHKQDS